MEETFHTQRNSMIPQTKCVLLLIERTAKLPKAHLRNFHVGVALLFTVCHVGTEGLAWAQYITRVRL